MIDLPSSPAAERNKEPLLQALRHHLPAGGRLLEIASGTGQHAAWIGQRLPGWEWQPTEANSAALPTIAAWTRALQANNVLAPCLLDVNDPVWPTSDETLASAFQRPFDAVYCANLLHIAPWSACTALMQGASHHLASGGQLLVYGPFLETGVATAPGNLAFDASLRSQNPAWGLRELEAVTATAQSKGLHLAHRLNMPANNLLLIFTKA
jgi:hypothetical protein